MIITPTRALEGVAETLEKIIIPELSSPYARGQAFAALSLVQGLSARWGEVEQLYAVENNQLGRLLRLFVRRCSPTGKRRPRVQELCRRILSVTEEARSTDESYTKIRSQNILLRSLLVELLVHLDRNDEIPKVEDLRRRIRRHLKRELKNELRLALESKMKEVSKG